MPIVKRIFQFSFSHSWVFLYFLRRSKKDEMIEKKATPLFFFFSKKLYVYVNVCVYV